MNPLVLFVAFMLMRDARAIVELDCSDNATCIDNMAKEVIRSVRQQRTVRLFNVLTIEPMRTRQARMSRSLDSWLETFLDGNVFSFDWNDYTFKLSQADDSNALDLEIYQGRTAKDVSDPNGKKSSSKNEEEKKEEETPKLPGNRLGIRRRQKKKVMQAIIPLLFGMKSAGVVLFAMAVVTVLTLKAFMASKVALLVTAGMAAKRLYETYGTGVGLQNHPYLYSQYPIDFPSASSHAYSVSGVSPQFASPEMYSPTAMGAQSQANEIIHQGDATAQQSQQAPTLLVNSTRAAERWDGKSKLLKFLEPLIDGVRSIIDPIANAFYGAMPATFRGLNSDVSTKKSIDPATDDALDELEIVKKPRQILIPQPRYIAQRKMNYRKNVYRPKKYSELKISLDRLKHNKDFQDYIKTKKYKYNYPNTNFYPRVKYFVTPNNPNYFLLKPNNSRLLPYSKEPTINITSTTTTTTAMPIIESDSEWKPIVSFNRTERKRLTKKQKRKRFRKRQRQHKKPRNRTRRSIDLKASMDNTSVRSNKSRNETSTGRFFFSFFEFLAKNDPVGKIISLSAKYTSSKIDDSLESDAPGYYSVAYNLVMMTLDFMEGLFDASEGSHVHKRKNNKKKHLKSQYPANCTQNMVNTTSITESNGNGTRYILKGRQLLSKQ